MEYRVIRQHRKSLRIDVQDGELVVKAPYFLSSSFIARFVRSKEAYWRPLLEEPRSFHYLGEVISIERIEEGWRFEDGRFYSDGKVRENIAQFLRARAKEYIPPRVDYLAKRFGDRYGGVRITSAKTRWGSCSSQGNLNFSWRLMMHSLEVIDYVIVHELCHLTHMNHSRKFWELVERRVRNYKECERRLKEIPIIF